MKTVSNVFFDFGPLPGAESGSMKSPSSMCLCGCSCAHYMIFSRTGRSVFLMFGMKLLWDKCKKVAVFIFVENHVFLAILSKRFVGFL